MAWLDDVPLYASLHKYRYVCPTCGHSFYPAPLSTTVPMTQSTTAARHDPGMRP
ncbi:MAG: hypothetical protein LKI76_02185 [Megasphaera sp.]|uniref:hypothetical protein n=1 Tax=Megasphaera sueciensis TaxID=349094 RepID=UPI003D069B1D|nr:hypothetical protein [Megasphaera sp.]MCI1822734.1 hypothetical protein [Megasphaera sp.]